MKCAGWGWDSLSCNSYGPPELGRKELEGVLEGGGLLEGNQAVLRVFTASCRQDVIHGLWWRGAALLGVLPTELAVRESHGSTGNGAHEVGESHVEVMAGE